MKQILFTTDYNLEEYIEIAEEDYNCDQYNKKKWEELTEEEKEDYMHSHARDDVFMNFTYLSEVIDIKECVMVGTAGVWNGTFKAYKLIEDMDEFKSVIGNYDYIKIYKDNKRVFVDLYHHDGRHHFEILKMRKNKNLSTLQRKQELGEIDPDSFDFSKYCKRWGD